MKGSKAWVFLILLLSSCLLVSLAIFFFSGIEKTSQELPNSSVKFNTLKPKSDDFESSLLLGGDVMLGRNVMLTSLAKKDSKYPFRKVSDFLKSADITFVNLENAIVKDCPKYETGYSFCGLPEMVEGLVFSGIDVVTLANNHSKNFGEKGLKETVEYLDKYAIYSTGLGELVILEKNGTRFGFLGFDKSQQTLPKLTESESNLISDSDSKVDILIIAMHWGVEYQSSAPPGVRNLAKELVKLGADLIVGHHPHWVQNMEYVDEVPVYYSLGNFVFDQMWSEETKKGMLVRVTYENKKLVKEEKFQTYIRESGQPELVDRE